jgi:hypothetical protein
LTTIAIGLLVMARTFQYYDSLLWGWDAQFYYAAARSLVFDGDLDLTNDIPCTPRTAPFDRDQDGTMEFFPRDSTGRVINKYPVGLSLVEVPWLALGHTLRTAASLFGTRVESPPGYSAIETNIVAIGLLMVFAVGLQAHYSTFRSWAPWYWCALGIIGAWWGTSLLYYSCVFPFMAHAMSFSIISIVLYMVSRPTVFIRANWSLAFVGALIGLLYLVRPQQAILAPLLLPRLSRLVRQPRRTWVVGAVSGATACAALVGFQALVNHANLGVYTFNSYAAGGEGFSWLTPRFGTVLASPSRGLLWISPVVVVSLMGYALVRRWPYPCSTVLVISMINLYLIACWSSPEQGDSFGARMWCDSAAMVSCGIILLHRSGRVMWSLAALAVAGCCLWTGCLMALYLKGGIPAYASYADVLSGLSRLVSAPPP